MNLFTAVPRTPFPRCHLLRRNLIFSNTVRYLSEIGGEILRPPSGSLSLTIVFRYKEIGGVLRTKQKFCSSARSFDRLLKTA
jgi:hypothetical protein